MIKPSENLCSFFWKHLCVRPGGKLLPCCHFEDSKDSFPTLTKNFENLESAWKSPALKELRQKSLSNQVITGCVRCHRVEAAQKPSLRNWANANYALNEDIVPLGDLDGIEYLEIFVGSTCNLKCLTCGPDLSSSWRQDYKALGWPLEAPTAEPQIMDVSFIKRLSNLREIKFVGGEPLLSKFHEEILAAIPQEKATQIVLTYYSNASVPASKNLLQAWEKFKKIQFWFSIDGFEKVNEYIRFPSVWSQVQANVENFLSYSKKNPAFVPGLHCTLNIYNIFSVEELENWYRNIHMKWIPRRELNLVFYPLVEPSFLAIHNLPDQIKEIAANKLDRSSFYQEEILKILEIPQDRNILREFLAYSKSLDKLRGVSLQSILPMSLDHWASMDFGSEDV